MHIHVSVCTVLKMSWMERLQGNLEGIDMREEFETKLENIVCLRRIIIICVECVTALARRKRFALSNECNRMLRMLLSLKYSATFVE